MVISFIFLVLGLVLVIKGADFLIDGSSSLAKNYKIPEIAIGLTVVAFGTSAPELVVNIYSSIAGRPEMVLGNIIGSNVFNTLLVLGIAALIYPLAAKRDSVRKEIPFSLLAVGIFFVLGNDGLLFGAAVNTISRLDGLILLGFFVTFLYYTFGLSRIKSEGADDIKTFTPSRSWLYILLGMGGLLAGGKLVVDNAVVIAQQMGVSQKLIALTIIACGTSLPELATTAVAAYKKRSDLAIGNIIGSNIFNILLVLGASSAIRPIAYQPLFNLDLYVLAIITAVILAILFIGKCRCLKRGHAIFLLVTFLGYMVFVFSRR